MNWKTNQHVLDICCVFSDWIEDGGVRVAFDRDGCVIHEDGGRLKSGLVSAAMIQVMMRMIWVLILELVIQK